MNNHQPIIIDFHQDILATLLNPQVKAEAAATLLQKVDAIKQSITQESAADLQEADELYDWAACMAMDDEVEVVGSGITPDSRSQTI